MVHWNAGEWCVEAGKYQDLGYLARAELESLNQTINGARCERLDSVVCFNSRSRLASNNKDLHATAARSSGPAPSESAGESSSEEGDEAVLAVAGPSQEVSVTTVGGRRLLLR